MRDQIGRAFSPLILFLQIGISIHVRGGAGSNVATAGEKDQALTRFSAVLAGARANTGSALPKASLTIAYRRRHMLLACKIIDFRYRDPIQRWMTGICMRALSGFTCCITRRGSLFTGLR